MMEAVELVATDHKLNQCSVDLTTTVAEHEGDMMQYLQEAIGDNMEKVLDVENMNEEEGKRSRPRTMQKIKTSLENKTKSLGRQTASLVSTVGTWTSSILKHDKIDKGDDIQSEHSQADDVDKYLGIVEKYGTLAQKMKTLLKIGENSDDRKSMKNAKESDDEEGAIDIGEH